MNIWPAIDRAMENKRKRLMSSRGGAPLNPAPMRLKVLDVFTVDVILNETIRHVTTLAVLQIFYQDCGGSVRQGTLFVVPTQVF